MTLVDTNVLLDVFTRDPTWLDWSLTRLEQAALEGLFLIINDVIYAGRHQLVILPSAVLKTALADAGISVLPTPRIALFLPAGKAFTPIDGVLADFASVCWPISLLAPMLLSKSCRC